MLLVPLTAMQKNGAAAAPASAKSVNIPKAKDVVTGSFDVCNTLTGEITKMTAQDYIFGVVAAEMPALYETEALKAQAVAAYTYACYRRVENSAKNYDITTDHTADQSFITAEAAAEKWGDKAEEYTKKIRDATAAVEGYMLTYGGKPVLSVYHAISSGKTESAGNVWGSEYPYLQPVSSPGDKLSPDYLSTVQLSADELRPKLDGIGDLSGDPAGWFGEGSPSDSGTVLKIPVGGETVTGARVRAALNLRSSNFKAAYADGVFTFTVLGYGHGVGMSQYGANYMAKQGSDFKEILSCYYTGTKVQKVG